MPQDSESLYPLPWSSFIYTPRELDRSDEAARLTLYPSNRLP